MTCGFCGKDLKPGKRCPEHGHLELPWEGLGRRQRYERPLRLEPPSRVAVGVRDEVGQVESVAAWCDRCNALVRADRHGCVACGSTTVGRELKVTEVRFM